MSLACLFGGHVFARWRRVGERQSCARCGRWYEQTYDGIEPGIRRVNGPKLAAARNREEEQ